MILGKVGREDKCSGARSAVPSAGSGRAVTAITLGKEKKLTGKHEKMKYMKKAF
jgi:hypothetical protein